MDATEIVPLTEEAVVNLLTGRVTEGAAQGINGRRAVPRWPFPGTVEMWMPGDDGAEQLEFATCINLSRRGVGMLYDKAIRVGLELAIAIHQPEASLHGRARIRHCTKTDAGYYVGAQFIFEQT